MTPSTAGDITIVGETYTDNWDPANAQTEMEQFLTAADNDVQAVLSENDGMAGGVVAALDAQGLAGQVPVSGQDGDLAGTQPRRPRHADRGRLEGRPPARPDRRRGCDASCAPTPTSAPWRAPLRSRRRAATSSRRSCSTRSRSPRTTSTSSSMPAGSTRPRCARASSPARSPSATPPAVRLRPAPQRRWPPSRDHGRLTTPSSSMCLRPAPASWRRTLATQAAP